MSPEADLNAIEPQLREALLSAPRAVQASNSNHAIPYYEHVVALARQTANCSRSRIFTTAALEAGPDEEERCSIYAVAGESSAVPKNGKLLSSDTSEDEADAGPAAPIAGVCGTGLGYGGVDCQAARASCVPTSVDGSAEVFDSTAKIPDMALELRVCRSVSSAVAAASKWEQNVAPTGAKSCQSILLYYACSKLELFMFSECSPARLSKAAERRGNRKIFFTDYRERNFAPEGLFGDLADHPVFSQCLVGDLDSGP